MIGFTTPKVKDEYHLSSVVLRLLIEALQAETGAGVLVFRVQAPTRFEDGVHSTGLAIDVQLLQMSPEAQLIACIEMNQKFKTKGAAKSIFTLKADPHNLPNGKRLDTPHVHVQIPFDWMAEPRAFLEAYGYLEGLHQS